MRQFKLYFLVMTCMSLSSICYYLSLEGQNPLDAEILSKRETWIHTVLFRLSIYLVLSTFFFLTAVFVCFFFIFGWKLKFFFLSLLFTNQWMLFQLDQGANTIQHGSFNILSFCMIVGPILATVFFIKTANFLLSPHNFKRFLFGFFFSLFFIVSLRIFFSTNIWGKGLFGKQISFVANPHCVFDLPRINWGSLLPSRGQNFFMGSQTCPFHSSIAHFSNDEKEIILKKCSKNYFNISFLPKTEPHLSPFSKSTRADQEKFQQAILQAVDSISVNLNVPTVKIPEGSEGILVECENEKNLLVRVEVNQTLIKERKEIVKQNIENGELPERPLNVLIIYLDALARTHFYRRFPKTQKILENVVHRSGFEIFEFFKYNAVGVTTRPNTQKLFVSSQKTIWEQFRQKGYITALIDNSCTDWAAKYANIIGQTDKQFVSPFCLPEVRPLVDPEGNFHGPFSITRRCLGGKYVHSYVFEYLEKFWQSHSSSLRWAMASFNEGHEATSEVIGLLDDDLSLFIERGFSSGSFNNTAVYFLADHGLHMGIFFQLHFYSGLLENKLPLHFAMYPRWFLDQHPTYHQALQYNEQMLIHAGNIQSTWKHLLSYHLSNYHFDTLFEKIADRNCISTPISQPSCICPNKSF